MRVIVDSKGRTPPTARVFSEPGKVLLALGRHIKPDEEKAFEQLGAELVALPSEDGMVDLRELLKVLGEREITSVLVEGGGTLIGSLFDQGLVDKVIAFIAPIIIGGEGARAAVTGKGVDKMVDSIKLKRVTTRSYDQDLMFSGYVGG